MPSFCRWPLELRFFSPEIHTSWLKIAKSAKPLRDSLTISQNFLQGKSSLISKSAVPGSPASEETYSGLDLLNLDYTFQTPYLEKSRSVFDFEHEGRCVVCTKVLEHDTGLQILCPCSYCEAVTHVRCLGAYFTKNQTDSLIPIQGTCPSCNKGLRWVDLMKELSSRLRGRNEVDDVLRRDKLTEVAPLEAERLLEADTYSLGVEMQVQMGEGRSESEELEHQVYDLDTDDRWHVINDSEDSDTAIHQ